MSIFLVMLGILGPNIYLFERDKIGKEDELHRSSNEFLLFHPKYGTYFMNCPLSKCLVQIHLNIIFTYFAITTPCKHLLLFTAGGSEVAIKSHFSHSSIMTGIKSSRKRMIGRPLSLRRKRRSVNKDAETAVSPVVESDIVKLEKSEKEKS